MDGSDNEAPNAVQREIVIVPHVPGPLVSFDITRSRRERDDLDELIDELLPDVEDRPGWFDAGLVLLGAGLLAWAAVGGPPTIVLVLAIIALGLGCILPMRAAWRRARQRGQQRRREALLAKGVAMDISSPVASRLVQAYDIVLQFGPGGGIGAPAAAAAHGAVLEVASLLKGRPPTSERESDYVETRAAAVQSLAAALREIPQVDAMASDGESPVLDSGALVEAREELDQIAGFNSVSRLDELTQEVRMQHGGHD